MSEAVSLIPDALVTSGVRDERQRALAQLFGEALGEIDLAALAQTDPLSVDARLLPFLIVEFGAQDFIDPELPEYIQRRILSKIWELKSLHGYDAGVKLGLSLLGISAEITHWHETDPQGPPNTHNIQIAVGEKLFDPDADVFLGDSEVRAAKRMIEACKRASQDTTTYIGVRVQAPPRSVAGVAHGASVARLSMRVTQSSFNPKLRHAVPVRASAAVVTEIPMSGGSHA